VAARVKWEVEVISAPALIRSNEIIRFDEWLGGNPLLFRHQIYNAGALSEHETARARGPERK
jgi:hypothetical protein